MSAWVSRAVMRLGRLASLTVTRVAPGLPKQLLPPGSARRGAYDRVVRSASSGRSPAPRPPFEEHEVPEPALNPSDNPDVSIIVTSWNSAGHTLRCLASIGLYTTDIAYEVIVVDDASTEIGTVGALERVAGLRLIALDANVGYLRATNRGREEATASLIVLLNNDVQVTTGWLSALVGRMRSDPGIGIVGSKLVYPNGSLQEAGSIVWRDGTGWNYGNGDGPDNPEYRFLREVDYVSAACVLVRGSIGPLFDDRYAPAYFEDVDLCFRAREQGFKVVYEPRSVVVHHEGVSHGRDVTSGLKRHQVLNRSTFVDRWRSHLEDQLEPDPSNVPLARDRRRQARVLVVDHKIPMPDVDSGSVRMTAILAALSERGHPVHFNPSDLVFDERYAGRLESMGVEVLDTSASYRRFLRTLAPHVRLCILSRPVIAAASMRQLRHACPSATIVYDMVDLHVLRLQRLVDAGSPEASGRELRRISRLEKRCIQEADVVFAITADELDHVREQHPGTTVFYLPNIHSVGPEPAAPGPERTDVVFVGGFEHVPNIDAARFINEDIGPRAAARLPHVTIRIIGRDVPASLIQSAPSNVRYEGWVPDLDATYASARAVLAPVRVGAGMKGKVGEAMAHGVPVVATAIGAEGYGADAESFLHVRHDAEGIVDGLVSLFEDDDLWRDCAQGGWRHVVEELSDGAARRRMDQILEDLGIS